MAKTVKIVRTFPNAWYQFIVEGDATGLSESEKMIAESALRSAFPDGGDIIAAKVGTKTQKYSSLVCESYAVSGCKDKTEGKTFKVKVEADEVKNPETYKKYVGEGIDELRKRREKEIGDVNQRSDDDPQKNADLKAAEQRSDVDLVKSIAGGNSNRFDVTARVFDEWKDLFGTEIDKNAKADMVGGDEEGNEKRRKKTEDGVETVTHEEAAEKLQDEIVKAYEEGNTDRLRELRPLLPLLAWYTATYKRAFTTLFNAMTGVGEDVKASGYHRLVEVLPAVYDVAFGLDESDEARAKAEKYIGAVEDFDELGKQDPEASAKKRKEYAERMFRNVIYGRTLSEKVAADVTNSDASTQNTNFNRSERSVYNTYAVPFIQWFNVNKDTYGFEGKMSQNWTKSTPAEFNFAKGMYLLESMQDLVDSVENGVDRIKTVDGDVTPETVEAAYIKKITYVGNEENGGEKINTRKLTCFRGLAKETWGKLGLAATTKKVRGGEDVEDGEKSKGSRSTVSYTGTFGGTLDEFKEAFQETCESAKTRLEGGEERLFNEYADYQDQHEDEMKNIISGLDKGDTTALRSHRSILPQFNLRTDTKVFDKSMYDWLDGIMTDKMARLVFSTSLNQFRRNQMKDIGGTVTELGSIDDKQTDRVTAAGDSDDESKVGDEGTPNDGVSTDKDFDETDPDAVKFSELNDKFLAKSDEEIEKDAKDLNINPERAKRISEDWGKICSNPGGIGGMLNIVKMKKGKNAEGKTDVKEIEEIRDLADAEIKKEEERRESEYQAAQEAYDDAKDGGDKDAVKEAKRELDAAKKARKLSSKEKAEITRRIKAEKNSGKDTDVKTRLKDLVKSGNLADTSRYAGNETLLEIARHYLYMIAVNGTDEDTYVGLPDMLVLMLHDQIMAYHDTHKDDSLEYCIDKVAKYYRPEFLREMTKMSGVAEIAADTLLTDSVKDKYLASVEKILDMIEQSDMDAQEKLDMLEAVSVGFQLWCEKNDVVPEEINPEEDKDAIENHPEDAE